MKEFDIKRDIQIINQGGFWCEACLTSKPMDDMSPDDRYCLSCYDFLKQEAKLISGNPSWKPIKRPQTRLLQANSEGKELVKVSEQGKGIMSTLNDKKLQWTKLFP